MTDTPRKSAPKKAAAKKAAPKKAAAKAPAKPATKAASKTAAKPAVKAAVKAAVKTGAKPAASKSAAPKKAATKTAAKAVKKPAAKAPAKQPAAGKSAARKSAAAPAARKKAATQPAAAAKPKATPDRSDALAALAIDALEDLKGVDIRRLDVRGLTTITDVMVIATGTSNRHASSLANSVIDKARESGNRPVGVEGLAEGEWVLVNLGGVIVHVMQAQARAFYQLEKLWDFSVRGA